MINESTNYTIQIAYIPKWAEHCILISDDKTGEFLTMEQYDKWIQLIGGKPQC